MHFIQEYQHQSLDFCGQAMDFFKEFKSLSVEGSTACGINHARKKSKDMSLDRVHLLPWMKAYEAELFPMFESYFDRFNIFESMDSLQIEDDHYQLQYYEPGDGFYAWHCEDSGPKTAQRKLSWITYCNDIDKGGGTEFRHQEYKVKSKKGKTVIFPGSFTHTHRGVVAPNDEKLIITGWLCSYPI